MTHRADEAADATRVVPSKNQPFLARLRFAWMGLRFALMAEHSLRFQAATLVAVVIALAIFEPEPIWWGIVLLAGCAVLAAELFNTALEHLVDHLHPELHPRIRIVKDCAAAAVLLTVLGAVAVGVALAIHLVARG
jgi:undecaprenol kinase